MIDAMVNTCFARGDDPGDKSTPAAIAGALGLDLRIARRINCQRRLRTAPASSARPVSWSTITGAQEPVVLERLLDVALASG